MKNTVNIFEELNKMKNLIHAKRGTVISEQLLNSARQPQIQLPNLYSAGQPQTQLNSAGQPQTQLNSAGQPTNKLTNNQLMVSGLGFGPVPPEMADKLVKLGNLRYGLLLSSQQKSSLIDQAKKELEKEAAEKEAEENAKNADIRRKNIRDNYCSVKDGKIENPNLDSNGQTWESYVGTYKITGQEIANVRPLCPDVVVPDVRTTYKFGDDLSKALNIKGRDETRQGNKNNVDTRFVKSATDLGIQSDKMDLQTLQSILDKLQDEGSQSTVKQDSGVTTSETPDLKQLSTLLNQLNT